MIPTQQHPRKRSINNIMQSYSFLTKELMYISIMLIAGGLLFHRAEGWTYFQALYFTVITMTGVGFGDVTATTTAGKIITMIYAILGVPMFVYTTSIVLQLRFKRYLSHMRKHLSSHPDYEPQHPIEKLLFQVFGTGENEIKEKI